MIGSILMDFRYETERLILMVGDESLAPLVLDYVSRNREDFGRFDRTTPEEFYTLDYQRKMLSAEQKLVLRSSGIRYYMFLKEQPDFIVGNVSFAYLTEESGHRCSIGYRTDAEHRCRGYAYEAASFLIPIISAEYHIKRIEADILPENEASLALIKKLGFEYEGVARGSHEIAGVERDHLRFSYLPDIS